ncbi:hypothetical protein [Calothrix sp. PCC 6303]|uniref:hypothetical protein n=1 Tax=Calothrix sp. PCC 6303 TaxID=1170562 RepID=UPI0002A00FAA|nr:hypothetical protein [Calothrix sp. PCC 6303]AFZ02512.1 hypothetical protein Cal6303_3587 [Calothrix sp. PCC 6303]
MPKPRLLFSLAIASIIILPVGIADAGGVNIQTSNVQMTLGGNGGVSIKTTPRTRSRVRANRNTRKLNCYGVSRRSQSRNGSNQVYSSTSTTTCN